MRNLPLDFLGSINTKALRHKDTKAALVSNAAFVSLCLSAFVFILPKKSSGRFRMRVFAIALAISLVAVAATAQRPSDPALLIPQTAPELDYTPVSEPFSFPPGMSFNGAPAALAFDSKAHLYVVTRGNPSLYEFDVNGRFIRSFGEGLF